MASMRILDPYLTGEEASHADPQLIDSCTILS
jgi:hypothetical protein